MTTIFGTFYWTGDLPDDDDVERAPEPIFSADYGEQWQYMATEPVIQSLCGAMRLDDTVTDLRDPNPEDHGWYTYLTVNGWTWFLYVHWVPDADHENCFEFDVRLCNNWWHRIFHRSVYDSRVRSLGFAIANALATANEIEGVEFSRRAA
jgi:hypothetical protein